MIQTTKKDFPTLLEVINKAIEKAIKEYEQDKKSIKKTLTT